MSKKEFYTDLARDLAALSSGEYNFIATLSNASALIYERLEDVNWVGFYLVDGNTLVLAPFQGKLACVRIPIGKGVCGTAFAKMRSNALLMCTLLPVILPVMQPVMLKLCCLLR